MGCSKPMDQLKPISKEEKEMWKQALTVILDKVDIGHMGLDFVSLIFPARYAKCM